MNKKTAKREKPEWLNVKINRSGYSEETEKMLSDLGLNTVCKHASCPNIVECYGKGRATFMILGSVCTRNCTFCDVVKGKPLPIDATEPERIAQAVGRMKMRHIVITSVTRDDLPDGGAGHFAAVINAIKAVDPNLIIEVLIPDFGGDEDSLRILLEAGPHIMNHNLETVPSLYSRVRPIAEYKRSLKFLQHSKTFHPEIYTKSGIMLGLGETEREVLSVLSDLRSVNCDFLTIGQYLRPSLEHHPVVSYVTPEQFDAYGTTAREMGFRYVASAPLVRSSYNAQEALAGNSL